MECYRANTAARLVDDDNQILSLRNNYKYFSFNFGPTLIHWLERNDPWVYRTIQEADKYSIDARGGHGNALAQVYNHIIMPLANQRDKVTQVRWGIRDFEYRFGRKPEGMWLAETAVDRKTLSVLADEGIKFTILSPFQAARWRFLEGDAHWRDAAGGNIPTGRAYRYNCGGGKVIYLFFYDPALARGVAFERLLEHSGKLLGQIDSAYSFRDRSRDEPWLVNVATDGESYGHHFQFGDMALAAAFQELERDPETEITNYGSFLARFPVVAEVEIFENSAWSCSHGLGRWSADCGCHIGGEEGWNQKWRAPLRKALDFVRDSLALHYESEMKKLCSDPWSARDEYIDVVLDRQGNLQGFLWKHLNGGPGSPNVPRFLKLLEMERFSLLMYTSCGWFFDEISQLEAVLIMKYAAMAMQLAVETGGPQVEPAFLEMLRDAPSNIPEFGNGGNVYLSKVKPAVVKKSRVAANYAIQSLARTSQREFDIYTYGVVPGREENLGVNPVPCLFGRISINDARTRAAEDFLYAVIHFGGLDFRCWVKPDTNESECESILQSLQEAVEEQDTIKMVRVLDEKFGTDYFGLSDVFKDLRSSIALEISCRTLGIYTDLQRNLFQNYGPLIQSLKQWGIKIPGDFTVSMRRVLSDEAEQLVKDILAHEEANFSPDSAWDEKDFFFRAHMARLNSILGEAKSWGVALYPENFSRSLGQHLVKSISELIRTYSRGEAGRFYRLLSVCTALSIRPETWKLQTLYFEFLMKGLKNPWLLARIRSVEKLLGEIDKMLGCRFVRLFQEESPSLSLDIAPSTGSRAVVNLSRHGSD